MKSPEIHGKVETLIAPPEWGAIDFLSDLHLDADHPRTVEALRRHLLHTPAQAVFLLGDIFEVWVGDDARHEGFEAECLALLREASTHRQLFFMAGNRDFLLGPAMAADAGMRLLSDPTRLQAHGMKLLLSHGDALCLDDAEYQRFRSQVRDPAWQREVLSRPLEQRRALARQMRAASQGNMKGQGTESIGDLDPDACRTWLQETGCRILLHGHTHRPAVHDLGEGLQRWVLSDWDLDVAPARGDVLRLSAAGLQRIALT